MAFKKRRFAGPPRPRKPTTETPPRERQCVRCGATVVHDGPPQLCPACWPGAGRNLKGVEAVK